MAHTFSCSADAPLVRTTGGSVRGYRFDGLDIFKGIPYAKARRFHAPEPAVWDGVLDATSYGYVCPLLEMPKPNGEMLVPHRYWLMDEACQNLNIWTPALDDAHRPVLVWLHGGGYFAGSSIEQIAYEGENMARLGDCVVVSINHRLNILGYLDLSDFGAEYANSGNAGGDDIIAALRWVRDNIAAFGGDPGNVTVFGQSGGGAKVTTLLQTPAADGLFHKGIVMSGVLGRLADCTGSGRDCAEALMAELGAADIAALETVPYAALAAAYNKVAPALKAAGKNTGCAPHPNAFYLGDPLENAFRPETARIPLLVGTVFGEFAAFNGFGLNKAQMSAAEAEGFAEKMLGKQTADALLPLFHAGAAVRPQGDPCGCTGRAGHCAGSVDHRSMCVCPAGAGAGVWSVPPAGHQWGGTVGLRHCVVTPPAQRAAVPHTLDGCCAADCRHRPGSIRGQRTLFCNPRLPAR